MVDATPPVLAGRPPCGFLGGRRAGAPVRAGPAWGEFHTWPTSGTASWLLIRAANARGFAKYVQVHYMFGGPPARRHYLCGEGGKDEFSGGRIFSGRSR
jgi:hypothetical protein